MLSYYTVCNWVKMYSTTGDYKSKQAIGSGRPVLFDNKESVLTYIKNNPDANGIEIRDAVAPTIKMTTFYETLSRMNITYKKKSRNISREIK